MSDIIYYLSKEGVKAIVDGVKQNFSPIHHTHTKSEITDLTFDSAFSSTSTNAVQNKVVKAALDGKAASSHGTHVSYSTTAPIMDGIASVGSASTVARSDHKHPTDTSRAAQTSLDSHTGNTTMHITSTERTNWNTAYTHSQSAHAPSNAEANQNAFSNVKIGDVTIAADIKTDTLTLVAGNNITLTPDATNDKITIAAKDTTYSLGSFGITATASELNYVDGVTSNIQTQLDSKSDSGHTHSYAGSSSVGGAATSANKLNTNAGSATQPVYFENGIPVATSYTLGASVPSNAKFTDTNTKVTNTLATTTKAYVTGTTSATTNTGTQVFDTGVYLDTTAGKLTATTFNGTTFSGSGIATVSEVKTYLGI